jgi:diguanylate cyclase (GGDEF)-like protein
VFTANSGNVATELVGKASSVCSGHSTRTPNTDESMCVRLLRLWWLQTDLYDWLRTYLQVFGLQRFTRAMMAGFTASLATVAAVLVVGSEGPHTTVAKCIWVGGSAIGFGWAVRWLRGWPSSRQSRLFAISGDLCMVAICFTRASETTGLLACMGFSFLAAYVSVFHSPRLMTLHFAVAAAGALAVGMHFAQLGKPTVAVCLWVIVAITNLAIPFTIQLLVGGICAELHKSSYDSLTGVLSRRAAYVLTVRRLCGSLGIRPVHAVATLIDIDNFKRLNDTFGHAVGDKALSDVGQALQTVCPETSLLGRLGGEEFIVIDLSGRTNPLVTGEKMREAVAATPHRVTASVGIASLRLHAGPSSARSARQFVDELIACADAAMYEAKRAGGDRTCHRELCSPTPDRLTDCA